MSITGYRRAFRELGEKKTSGNSYLPWGIVTWNWLIGWLTDWQVDEMTDNYDYLCTSIWDAIYQVPEAEIQISDLFRLIYLDMIRLNGVPDIFISYSLKDNR